MPHEFSEPLAAQTAEAHSDQNPYASPQAAGPLLAKNAVSEPIGIWRAGNVLIMHRDAELPPRCVVTNEPCDETELHEFLLDSRRTIRVAQATVGLIGGLIALGLLLSGMPDSFIPAAGAATLTLLIISLFTIRRPHELRFRYGIKHGVQIRRLLYRNAGLFLGPAGLMAIGASVGIAQIPQWLGVMLMFPGIFMMVGGAVTFLSGRFPLRIERPPGNYLLLHGAGREFVANFPQAAIGLPFLGRIFPKPLN